MEGREIWTTSDLNPSKQQKNTKEKMTWIKNFHDDLLAKTLLDSRDSNTIEGDVLFLEKVLELRPNQRILDQCCGHGTMSLALAQKGYRVCGVDMTKEYIASAQAKAEQFGLPIEFSCADAGTHLAPECDAVFNWWTGFGYSPTDKENISLIQRAFDSLRSGGIYLLDVPNLLGVARHFAPTVRREYHTDVGMITLTRHSSMDLCLGRMEKIWEYSAQDALLARHHTSVRLYSSAELWHFFHDIGFRDIRLIGDLQETPLTIDHLRCMCIGRKP